MKQSFLTAHFLLLLSFISSVGCSVIQQRYEAQMNPLARIAYDNKKVARANKMQAIQMEKDLNLYFAARQTEFPSIATDAEGLRQTRDIATKVEKDIESLRFYKGVRNYTSPQLQEFSRQFRITRNRQLDALRPLLTDESGRVPSPTSGLNFLIHSGMFSDAGNPVYHAAIRTQTKIIDRLHAENERVKNEQSARAAEAFFEILKAAQEAKKKHIEELKVKGICPDCEGKGTITITTENKCPTCLGSGFTYVKGGICPICGGLGTIGVATIETKECKSCSGSGKYPYP